MTDEQWRSSTDPNAMLEWLRASGRTSDRKLRLIAAACCRRIWHLLDDERSRRAVEGAERYADGETTKRDLATCRTEAWSAARNAAERHHTSSYHRRVAHSAAIAAAENAGKVASRSVRVVIAAAAEALAEEAALAVACRGGYVAERNATLTAERRGQAGLIRELFAPPLHPGNVLPSWVSDDVATIAAAIYEERAFERMPILGDALEDAGCNDEFILTHCRSQAGHVRGCWVLDAVLGKE
jgi:hypothetical protein